MPAARSTSVGASVPNATRATPTSVTSPVTTHLPVLRQRPSGTSVYSTAMRVAVMMMTGSDGSAQPPQLDRMSTPNGRGRRAIVARPTVTMFTNCQASSHTSRCRQRRRTSNASSSPKYSVNSTHQEPTRARPRRSASSPGASSPASHLTTASSTTVTATAEPRIPRANTASASPTSTTAATSQPTPLVCSRYGSGGGAPVGRRRRGDRTASRRVGWTGGALVGVDWPADTSMAPPNRDSSSPASGPCLLVSGLSRLETRRTISRLRADAVGAG